MMVCLEAARVIARDLDCDPSLVVHRLDGLWMRFPSLSSRQDILGTKLFWDSQSRSCRTWICLPLILP